MLALWAAADRARLAAQAGTPAASPVYATDIQPILEQHCYECHGPNKSKGSLRLDIRARAFKGGVNGPAIVAGDSEHSLLVRRLLGLDGEDRMPLDKDPLPAARSRASAVDSGGRRVAGASARRPRPKRPPTPRTALGLSTARSPCAAGSPARGLGAHADRPLHPRAAGERRAQSVA